MAWPVRQHGLSVGVLAALWAIAPIQRAAADAVVGDAPALPFPVGEKLVYNIYWGAIPVAHAEAVTAWEEYEGRTVLAIRFRTRSNAFLSRIYPVNDFIESLVDPVTLLPIRFTKTLNEGRYHCDEVTYFDHAAGTARFEARHREKRKEFPIAESTRDLVSFMYFMRGEAARFTVGKEEKFQIMTDEKLYDLFVKPVRKEAIQIPGFGKVKTVRFEPEAAFEGIFVRKGRLWLWVSDDERRIITRVRAKVPLASVKIQIAKVEGPGDDFWTEDQAEKTRLRKRRR